MEAERSAATASQRLDAATAPQENEGLDDFMERTKEFGYPASIRRAAWATGRPAEQLWQEHQAFKRGYRGG